MDTVTATDPQRGSTLFEVIVALSIGMFTAALIWRAEPLGTRLALRAAAIGLISDLRLMQGRAIGERSLDRAYGLEVPVGATAYMLFVGTGDNRIPLRTRALPPGVRVSYARFGGTNSDDIFFTGVSLFGAPSGGGTVTFTNKAGRLCVRVAPATARARVTNVDCP